MKKNLHTLLVWVLLFGLIASPAAARPNFDPQTPEPGQPLATDLAIVKTGSPSAYVLPGGALTYTLHASNLGPQGVITTTTTVSDLTTIIINDNAAATPYPGLLTFTGLEGTVSKVTVTLSDFNHASPEDVDVLLVGPQGQQALLMSDVGGNLEVGALTFTFDDDAAGPLPDGNVVLVSGVYQPTDYPDANGNDIFPAPAPAGPYTTPLSVFNGIDPNGDWALYVRDDAPAEPGDISGGWSLTLEMIQDARVRDPIPAGVGINTITPPAGWNCTQNGQLVSCTTDNLPSSASADILVGVTVPATTGTIQNTAFITSTLSEVNSGNNSSTWTTIVDTPPIAVDDVYTGTEGMLLTVDLPGVLFNDSDPDGNPLSVSLDTPPVHGGVTLNPDGSLVYTPDANFSGLDQFTYLLSDTLLTSPAVVYLNILSLPDPPNAVNNDYSLQEDTPYVVSAPGVLGNDNDPDGDPLTAAWQSGPSHGDLLLNADGSFVYTPTLNYTGSDSFTYLASDGALNDAAAVSLNINAVNDPPVANPDTYAADQDTPLAVDAIHGLLANDQDVDSPTLTAILASMPAHGALALNADGSFVYTPTLNYHGLDGFDYIASDGAYLDTTTVSIDVAAPNQAPVVNAGADQSVVEGGPVDFSGSFSDPGRTAQADNILWEFGDGAAAGGALTSTHTYQDNGVFTATLTITDALGAAGSDLLVITVANAAPNLAPLDAQTTPGERAVTVMGQFSDPGILDTHTVVIAWQTASTATLQLAAGVTGFSSSHVFTAAGVYIVTVTVTDKDGDSSTRTIQVTVTSSGNLVYLPLIQK